MKFLPILGSFAVAFSTAATDASRERIDAMIDELKRCPAVEGADEVLYPGELEGRREAAARAEGVELPVASEKELARAAEMTGVGDNNGLYCL